MTNSTRTVYVCKNVSIEGHFKTLCKETLYPPPTPKNNEHVPQVLKQVVNLSCCICAPDFMLTSDFFFDFVSLFILLSLSIPFSLFLSLYLSFSYTHHNYFFSPVFIMFVFPTLCSIQLSLSHSLTLSLSLSLFVFMSDSCAFFCI